MLNIFKLFGEKERVGISEEDSKKIEFTKKMEKLEKEYRARWVAPHKKISREVKDGDIGRILTEAAVMYNLCYLGNGMYPSGFAVAHSQIDDKDPLRFFVLATGEIIINPVIIRHTNSFVDSEEGCLSFGNMKPIIVQRWNKCEVEYVSLNADKKLITEKIKKSLSGKESKIYQHELDHLDGKNIFKI